MPLRTGCDTRPNMDDSVPPDATAQLAWELALTSGLLQAAYERLSWYESGLNPDSACSTASSTDEA